MQQMKENLNEIKELDNYKNVKKNANDAGQLTERIEKALEKVKSFNTRETLFKQQLSEYEELAKLIKNFEPY